MRAILASPLLLGLLLLQAAPLAAEPRPRTWKDIDYVGDALTGHQLDIYLPETGPGPFPVVVCIYGSAFSHNNGKGQFKSMATRFGEAGIAIAAINHRGTETDEGVRYPDLIHDVKAAVRFLRANAAAYRLDPDHIGALGMSSGGHLSAFLGTSGGVERHTVGEVTMEIEGALGAHPGTDSSVQAVCDWYGPTDFLVMDTCGSTMTHDAPDSPESVLVGGPIQDRKDDCALANPITYVDANDPPFLIIHGDADPLVPHCNSEALHEALEKAGVPSEFILVEGAGHGDGLFEPQYLDKMIRFFASILVPAKEGAILWRRPVGENIEASPAVDAKGNIYTTGGGNMWCFAPDGTLKWKTCALEEGCKDLNQAYPYPLSNSSSPAVSPDGRAVYVTGYAGVFAFDTRDGSIIWKKTVYDDYHAFAAMEYEGQAKMWKKSASTGYPQMFATTPAISTDGTRLYAGAGDNDFFSDSFFCISAKDGALIWEYKNPHPPLQKAEDFVLEVHPEETHVRGYLGGASLGPDGSTYIASMHGWLISLTDKGSTYRENWAYKVGAEMRMPPAMDAQGFLYVGTSDAGGYIHRVDSRTGKLSPGKWPVKTFAGEVFAAIAIGQHGTAYANSEDYRLWAFHPDGSVKWNNLKFEHWGGDPLLRADGRIIVTSQVDGAARVVCIRDDGDKAVIEWASEPITTELAFNEINVNIGPNGDIYVASGVESPHALIAIKGNGQGLSNTASCPKFMNNMENNGTWLAVGWPIRLDKASALQIDDTRGE